MNVDTAAANTLCLIKDKDTTGHRDSKGRTVDHACWMLHGIKNQYIIGEKAHRWLGYAQGILVTSETLTLEQCKTANLST